MSTLDTLPNFGSAYRVASAFIDSVPLSGPLKWLFPFLFFTACSSQTPAEKLAAAYWQALQTGEVARAYSYLSPGDRALISEEVFSARMRLELYPHLFFSQYGGTRVTFVMSAKPAEKGDKGASAEVIKVVSEGTHATVTAQLSAPDYRALPAFTEALSRADTTPFQEQRLVQNLDKLHRLPHPPLTKTWHRLELIQEEGAWRVTYPLWRAEAMLAQAKVLAADGQLEEARNLLDDAGRFAANLDERARTYVIRSASRGRRMLSQLTHVQLADFTLSPSQTCSKRASLTLRNRSYDLHTATVVVDFKLREGTSRQSFVLGKAEGAVSGGEDAYFELCLEPPTGWQGQANAKIGWLDFTEEVYKSHIE